MRERLSRRFGLTLLLLLLPVLLAGCSVQEVITQAVMSAKAPPEDYAAVDDGFRYAKSQLTPQQQYIYDKIVEGVQRQDAEIEDLYPDEDMIWAAVDAIHRDYPEFFWFSGGGRISTTMLGEIPLSSAFLPTYVMDGTERADCQQKVDRWTADCFASIPDGAADYDKVLSVYRYIIDHTDYQTVDANSIVNVMVNGYGLCGCYAMTTQYLLNQLGIDCAYVSGFANDVNHAWNLVWLDGNPCWLDTTWGDPVFEGGNATDGTSYDYFCITTADLLRTHAIDEGQTVPECVCEDYNYYRHSGRYFESYDWNTLVAPVEQAVAAGEKQVPLRFSDAAYSAAKNGLFSASQVYDLFQRVDADMGTSFSSAPKVTYSYNDVMGSITLILPY